MAAALMERPLVIKDGKLVVNDEWNHSCTSQCPPDCQAAKSVLARPQIVVVEPVTAADAR